MLEEKLMPKLLEVVLKRAEACIASETGVAVDQVVHADGPVDSLVLRKVTAVIAVGGPISFLAAFSFDQNLLDTLFERYTSDIEVTEDERFEFMHATAGDLVNLIMGQATADLELAEVVISISPPVVFEDARRIGRSKDARFRSATMKTAEGAMDVNVIGPTELFDSHLNYVK